MSIVKTAANGIDQNPTRRHFLGLTAGTAAASILLASQHNAFAQTAISPSDLGLDHNPTLDTSLKFRPDGVARPFPGNTVICHLPQQCRFRDGAAALREALRTAPFANKLGLLPVESYHMTVFAGANSNDRTHSAWPGGIPIDAPIERCNAIMKERMENVCLEGPFPLRVRIDAESTMRFGRACTLRMTGTDPAAEHVLRNLRNRLADAYRYRAPDHDTYTFHVTIAYQLTDMSPTEMAAYRAILRKATDNLLATTPVLELGLPEYCTFPDMYRFDVEQILQPV